MTRHANITAPLYLTDPKTGRATPEFARLWLMLSDALDANADGLNQSPIAVLMAEIDSLRNRIAALEQTYVI